MAFRGRPPPVDDGGDYEAKKASREAIAAEYFASLPTGGFSEEEEGLRSALLNVLAETGNVRLSIAAQREEVRQAKQQLNMPQGAGLSQWVAQRAADDFSLVAAPDSGEKLLCAAGMEHEAEAGADSLEDFYASLPADEFTEEEAVLREQVLTALKRLGGRARLSQFTRGEQARDFQKARHALLPKGAPFVSWLERRMGSEVAVEAEAQGGHTASLLPAGRSAAASLQKAQTNTANAAQWPHQPRGPPPGHKEYEPDVDQQAAREQARLDKEARVQEYFDSLPGEALTLEEQVLREALFASIEKQSGQAQPGVQVRLSRVCQETEVRNAKVGLLPTEVTVATWIESRIGGDIVLSKDSFGQVMCERASDSAPEAGGGPAPDLGAGNPLKRIEERDAGMVEHFQGHPYDRQASDRGRVLDARMVEYFQGHPALTPIERSLKSTLLEAIARKGGDASRLSDVLNSQPPVQNAWKTAKATWLAQGLEVSFARWVELRMGEEVKITREPYVELRGSTNKRGAQAMAAAPYQSAYNREQPPAKMARANGARPGQLLRPLGAGPPARPLGLRPGANAMRAPIGIRPAYPIRR